MNSLAREAWRYTLVAGLGLVLDFGTLVLLTEVFNVDYLLSAVCGFSLGLLVTFTLSEVFVFTDPRIRSRTMRFVLFGGIGMVGLGILALLMWVQVDLAGINYVVAKILATGVVYAWNFFARRTMYRRGHA